MILIADSGSTKCDWVLLSDEGEIIFKTQTLGLNPNTLTTQKMHKRLAQSNEISHVNDKVDRIYFYGAGCGTKKNQHRLKRFLEKYFRRSIADVQEDLMSACLAVTPHKPGIICILGTGSNSCYYDGKNIETPSPSLGYLIMDEGSGNYFGKRLLRDYFYKKMPKKIALKFKSEFELDPSELKISFYKEQNPNAFLAKFSRFIFENTDEEDYFKNLLKSGFQDFIDNWVNPLSDGLDKPIHFVGSVAHFSKNEIAEVIEENNLTLGNIIRYPIEGLTNYFQEKLKENSQEKKEVRR